MPNKDPEKERAYQRAYAARLKESLASYKKAYAAENAEAIKAKKRAYYLANKEHIKAKSKARYEQKPEAIAAYREANKERIAAYQKEYDKEYREENKEEIAEYMRDYYQAHKAELIAAATAWMQRNPERSRALRRKWKRDNKDAVNRMTQRRRAKLLDAMILEFTQEAIDARVDYYGRKCAYCKTGPYEHLDHVIALDNGGPHVPANLRPACVRCNTSKGAKILEDWMAEQIDVSF